MSPRRGIVLRRRPPRRGPCVGECVRRSGPRAWTATPDGAADGPRRWRLPWPAAWAGDEGPLEVVIGLLDHPSVVDLPTAGLDLGDEPGVAGEVMGRREAID